MAARKKSWAAQQRDKKRLNDSVVMRKQSNGFNFQDTYGREAFIPNVEIRPLGLNAELNHERDEQNAYLEKLLNDVDVELKVSGAVKKLTDNPSTGALDIDDIKELQEEEIKSLVETGFDELAIKENFAWVSDAHGIYKNVNGKYVSKAKFIRPASKKSALGELKRKSDDPHKTGVSVAVEQISKKRTLSNEAVRKLERKRQKFYLNKERYRGEVLRAALVDKTFDINETIPAEHKQIIVKVMTAQANELVVKMSDRINRKASDFIYPYIPNMLLRAWRYYPDSVIPAAPFLYQTTGDFAKDNTTYTVRIQPNIPFYFGPDFCEAAIKAYTDGRKLMDFERNIESYYKLLKQRTRLEVVLANKLAPLITYYDLLKLDPILFDALDEAVILTAAYVDLEEFEQDDELDVEDIGKEPVQDGGFVENGSEQNVSEDEEIAKLNEEIETLLNSI